MKTAPIFFRIACGAMVSVACLACEASGAGGKYVGTWLRTRTLTTTGQGADEIELEKETWELEIRADGTFTEVHSKTNNPQSAPPEPREKRQGSWQVEDDGHLVLTGDWLDLDGPEMDSLNDVRDNLYTFTRRAMAFLDSSGDHLFVGPDVTYFTDWPHSESYVILYYDVDNSRLWRDSAVQLVDADGEVVQERIESVSFQVTGANECSGQYSLSENDQGSPTNLEGELETCTYWLEEGVTVEGVGGEEIQVQAVQFEYTVGGSTDVERESYIQAGDHFLEHRPGEQADALRNSAFVRVN